MIALDTNVLLRFLVQDDQVQTARVRRLIREVIRKNSACFISDIVICELTWVLRKIYRFKQDQIIEVLAELISADYTAFSSRPRLLEALEAHRTGHGDFSDYLIREQAREAGCDKVVTFDRDLLKEQGFSHP